MNIFIERLRTLIGDKKAVEIANEIDISPSTLSLYLSGKRVPHLEVIVKLCNYFHVSSDYLLGLTDEPNAKGEVPMDYEELKEIAEKYRKTMEMIEEIREI